MKTCNANKHVHVGDEIELGQCIGYTNEPGVRWGRLVGIRKSGTCREIERFIIREYQEGDDAWPTGEYRTTSIIALQPHRKY